MPLSSSVILFRVLTKRDFLVRESNAYGKIRVSGGVLVIERSSLIHDNQTLEPNTKYEFNDQVTVGFLMSFDQCLVMASLLNEVLTTWRLYYGK